MCALEQYLNERNIPLTSLEANSINEGVVWGLEMVCEYLRTHLWENKDPDGDPIVESVHNITKENFIKDIKRYVFDTKSQPKKKSSNGLPVMKKVCCGFLTRSLF